MYDLSLNRVFWKYNNGTYMRPSIYEGVEVNCPKYKNKGPSIKDDLFTLSQKFYDLYKKDYKLVVTLSGGIDSEITAETLYQLNIPFRVISLSLFGGKNYFDLLFVKKFCKDRKIDCKFIDLSLNNFVNNVIPKSVEFGQFTDSLSQSALTYLFDYVDDNEILIFSGHNPDHHTTFGWGWWEDSPNLVKYAINKDKNFFTFTSLEPIFMHYTNNYDPTQPGDKDNTFIYNCYPNLQKRTKRTGWETLKSIHYEYSRLLNKPTWKDTNERVQVFIRWK